MKVEIIKSTNGKWFQDRFNLKDLLTLSNAVTRINGGYVKKDQRVDIDDDNVSTKLPNLFIINNFLGIEKFKTKANRQHVEKVLPSS